MTKKYVYSSAIQEDFREKIWESCKKWRWQLSDEDTEIVRILAPLMDNPNAPDENGDTPIHEAALNGHTEIVKILGPLTDNPNTPNNKGETPIHKAASDFGIPYKETQRILESFNTSILE